MLGISFIVPTHNEENYIQLCLSKIEYVSKGSAIPVEIILVDNNSTDKTLEIASKFNVSVYLCNTPNNPAATRNIGASYANFSILSFVDGDCIISENWIERLIETYEDTAVGAYGGSVLSPKNGNWIETTLAPIKSADYRIQNKALPGGNFSIRKKLFLELKGFNEKLITAEDDDLSKRVVKSNYVVINEGKHSVIHLGYPKTLASVFKKQLWHATSQLKAHGVLGDKLVFITIFWIGILFISLLSLLTPNTILSVLSLTLFSLIPLAFSIQRLKKKPQKNLITYLRMYLISWPFMLGRATGLILELINHKVIR